MKKVFRTILFVVLGLLIIGTFVFLWKKSQPKVTSYEIVTPQTMTIQKKTVATGKVEPRDEVAIVPQISGIVSALYKEAGQYVKEAGRGLEFRFSGSHPGPKPGSPYNRRGSA